MTRSDRERLRDILQRASTARATAEDLVSGALDARTADYALRALIYDLIVIGEAVRSMQPALLELQPSVPWARIVGMRNHLTHGYHQVNTDTVVDTALGPLLALEQACVELLQASS